MSRSTRKQAVRLATSIVAAAFATAPASAVDGVILINQARALAGGITAGDAPGFPVSLNTAGSYRLTGNLDVTGEAAPENVTAISVGASDVTIDLNGFSLVGPTVCTGSPVTACAPLGSGRGVHSPPTGLTVRNGSIRGFGGNGLLATNALVEGVQLFSNGGVALWFMEGGTVVDSTSMANGNDGFYGNRAVVQRFRAMHNKGRGIATDCGVVRDSEAFHNADAGIVADHGVALRNLSRDNGGCAILAFAGGYGENVAYGSSSLFCSGTALGANLCNGALCP